MKKLLIIGAIALVVIGCILAAGCTSTTEIPSADDQIIGKWTNSSGTTMFVINGNLTGAYYKLDNGEWKEDASILWTKNKDGTYYLINGNAKATVTLDPVKGIFTTDSGSTFTKQISEDSGYFITNNSDKNAKTTKINLDANGGTSHGFGHIKQGTNYLTNPFGEIPYSYPKYESTDPNKKYTVIGYFTEPTGGEKLFNYDGKIVNNNLPPYTSNGVWIYDGASLRLYTHWGGFTDVGDGFTAASAQW